MNFDEGARVRVAPHAFWPHGGVGTVGPFPDYVKEFCGGADGCVRRVAGPDGRPVAMVWVEFDEPVPGADLEGPYGKGEVAAPHLSPLEPGLS